MGVIKRIEDYVLYRPESGGKAGKGHNKTSSIQVRQGDRMVRQYRFKVNDYESCLKAIEKAEALVKWRLSVTVRVFKFTVGTDWYVQSGADQEEALRELKEYVGDFDEYECEEVPRSRWDIADITMYEDDDVTNPPYKVSIFDLVLKDSPTFISTNDSDLLP